MLCHYYATFLWFANWESSLHGSWFKSSDEIEDIDKACTDGWIENNNALL